MPPATPRSTKKNTRTTAQKREPKPAVLVHKGAAAHHPNGCLRLVSAATLGFRMKLMGAQLLIPTTQLLSGLPLDPIAATAAILRYIG